MTLASCVIHFSSSERRKIRAVLTKYMFDLAVENIVIRKGRSVMLVPLSFPLMLFAHVVRELN